MRYLARTPVLVAFGIACVISAPLAARSEGKSRGRATIFFDGTTLEELSLRILRANGEDVGDRLEAWAVRGEVDSTVSLLGMRPAAAARFGQEVRLSVDVTLTTSSGKARLSDWSVRFDASEAAFPYVEADVGNGRRVVVFELRDATVAIDRGSDTVLVEGSKLVVSGALAVALGDPGLEGISVGAIRIEAFAEGGALDFGRLSAAELSVETGGVAAGVIGPDVIVGVLVPSSSLTLELESYGSVGGVSAFSVGTTSCNKGDTTLLWVASTNEHPVIAQNMYRLKDGRFEQIGQSWLKHGFFALAGNACGLGCQNPGSGALLGVGCSDPYSASLNGVQSPLGPKSEVNAFTGGFLFPPANPAWSGPIARRLQVHDTDLDPALNPGALYFVEAHYVTPDDAAAGNQDNNASYRGVAVSGSVPPWTLTLTGSTQREQAGIRAWRDTDSSVVETNVRVPGEGLMILSAKTTLLGNGFWRYEYALQNLTSDRSAGAFTVPLPAGATIQNVGFHDVDYHSGETYDLTDWPGVLGAGELTWAATPYDTDPDSNALRWGTLYNFRFEADVAPGTLDVTIGLYKPGSPDSVAASTVGPSGPPPVCGDEIVEGGEECDPPDGVSCDSVCQWVCGDAIVQSGEECDPPDGVSCDGACQWVCGDGIVQAGEECDPPNGVGCDANCLIIHFCGDEMLGPEEECDPPDGVSCDEACQWVCGDGIVQSGEECDDLGESAVCDVDCTFSACGDLTVNVTAEEECDEGGDTEACDADCTFVECGDGITNEPAGELCDPPDGVNCGLDCLWICGDGVVQPKEECDPPDGELCNEQCEFIDSDACEDAFLLCPGDVELDSTVGATNDGSASCGSSTISPDVWYKYRPGADGTATVETCGSSYDTVLSVHTGCPGSSANQLACNDDAANCPLQSSLTFPVQAGEFYTIRLAGFAGATGSYTLTVDGPECCSPCDGTDCTDCDGDGRNDLCQGLADCDGNGVPDECEFADCNTNGVADVCDIADGTSQDCDGGPVGSVDDGAALFSSSCAPCHGADGSGIVGPDIRDHDRITLWNQLLPPTTHSGGVRPDFTDQDFADIEAFLASAGSLGRPDRVPDECQSLPDCDDDLLTDGCELEAGTQLDENHDGSPDECDCPLSDPPELMQDVMAENRYLAFTPGGNSAISAIRVSFADMPPRFEYLEGRIMWVGPPWAASENAGIADPQDAPTSPSFQVARLLCDPVFRTWSAVGTVHVFHAGIFPGATYSIQVIQDHPNCVLTDESHYSGAVAVSTSAWGDVSGIFDNVGGVWTAPDQSVDVITDVIAVLEKFGNRPGAPGKARVDVEPRIPDQVINISDVTFILDAFRGLAYPFEGPAPCGTTSVEAVSQSETGP